MFYKMITNTRQTIVDYTKSNKRKYNSRKVKQELELITQKSLKLMNARIPNPDKKHLTFNPIYENTYVEPTNNLRKIKIYFQNMYERIRTIYRKV